MADIASDMAPKLMGQGSVTSDPVRVTCNVDNGRPIVEPDSGAKRPPWKAVGVDDFVGRFDLRTESLQSLAATLSRSIGAGTADQE